MQRLSNPDVDTFRSIQLESLQQNPEAFGSTFEKELNEPCMYFVERFDRNVLFGGFVRGRLLGIVGFYPLEGTKLAHKGVLWGMYIWPEARGTGLATALVDSLKINRRSPGCAGEAPEV